MKFQYIFENRTREWTRMLRFPVSPPAMNGRGVMWTDWLLDKGMGIVAQEVKTVFFNF